MIEKDVLITGASGAIGGAIAKRLANAGYTVHLTSRKRTRLKPLTDQLPKSQVFIYELDLARLNQGQNVVQQFFKKAKHPYAMVCNAGDLGELGPFLKIPFDDWMQSLRQNFLGHAAMIHCFGRAFVAKHAKRGSIVLLSGAGLGGAIKHTHLSSYGTAKAALTYLAEALAPEFKDMGLTINAIAPGQVKSGLTEHAARAGISRAGDYALFAKKCMDDGGVSPELAAELVEFLLSPGAASISGRLLSARFDQETLRQQTEAIAKDADWFRLRRIDRELFSPK